MFFWHSYVCQVEVLGGGVNFEASSYDVAYQKAEAYLIQYGGTPPPQMTSPTCETLDAPPYHYVCEVPVMGGAHEFDGRDYADAYAKMNSYLYGCPLPISGHLTFLTNRIPVTLRLFGPNGNFQDINAMIDTGASETTFPDQMLENLGYSPLVASEVSGVVPGAQAQANLYRINGDAIQIQDGGHYVPLGNGSVAVTGVIGGGSLVDTLLGPDLFAAGGASVNLTGNTWTITPPCIQ